MTVFLFFSVDMEESKRSLWQKKPTQRYMSHRGLQMLTAPRDMGIINSRVKQKQAKVEEWLNKNDIGQAIASQVAATQSANNNVVNAEVSNKHTEDAAVASNVGDTQPANNNVVDAEVSDKNTEDAAVTEDVAVTSNVGDTESANNVIDDAEAVDVLLSDDDVAPFLKKDRNGREFRMARRRR